jgi:hypothetical protein
VLIGCSGGNAPVHNKPTSNTPESPDGPPWFEEITDKVGLNFSHDPGEDLEQYRLYECMGSGCAIADLDGDGLPDLILLTNAGPLSKSTNKIYRQKKDHTFEDVTIGSGIDFPGWNMGIAIGDVNNDGKPDILITQYNGVKLLLNKGGMKFEDVTNESGLINLQWGASAAFLDFDRDGWLDLCIVNYVLFDPSRPCQGPVGHKGNEWFFRPEYCGPRKFAGSASKLFRNRGRELTEAKNPKGPRVSFEDVSMKSGIGGKTGPGLGIAVADFDGDGWPDIFITNDMEPNCLWMNKRDGTFTEEAMARGVARSARGDANAGMGIAIGDASNTGLLDLYVTHLAMQTNILWKQGPPGSFRDVTAAWGLNALRWNGTGFGTVMADFDNDGWVDIAIVNGGIVRPKQERKKPGLSPHWEPYGERNQVLANVEGKKFRDISHNNPAFCEYFTVARGLACGDIDGNGSLDLLVNATGEKARLFKNVAPNRGHWVSVRAFDPSCHRDAIGAKVVARTDNIQRVRMIGSGESYLSACPLVAHFGLGKADKVDEYEVTWPDGTRERFSGGPVDRSIELRRGSGIR